MVSLYHLDNKFLSFLKLRFNHWISMRTKVSENWNPLRDFWGLNSCFICHCYSLPACHSDFFCSYFYIQSSLKERGCYIRYRRMSVENEEGVAYSSRLIIDIRNRRYATSSSSLKNKVIGCVCHICVQISNDHAVVLKSAGWNSVSRYFGDNLTCTIYFLFSVNLRAFDLTMT